MIIIDCIWNFTFLLFVGLEMEVKSYCAVCLLHWAVTPGPGSLFANLFGFSFFPDVLSLGHPMTKAAAPGLSGTHPRFPGV